MKVISTHLWLGAEAAYDWAGFFEGSHGLLQATFALFLMSEKEAVLAIEGGDGAEMPRPRPALAAHDEEPLAIKDERPEEHAIVAHQGEALGEREGEDLAGPRAGEENLTLNPGGRSQVQECMIHPNCD